MVWFHGGGQRTGSGDSAESLADIAAVMAGDASALRYAAHVIAQRKHAQGAAPVFLYSFTWRSPGRRGKLRSMHGMELPFVFDHADAISS
jgi:para-nitrobenzyl esterase